MLICASKTVEDLNGPPLGPGDILGYTIVISNSGSGTQGDNPGNEFEDPIPAHTIFVSGSAFASTGAMNFDTGENKITWNGSVAAGSTVTLQFRSGVGRSCVESAPQIQCLHQSNVQTLYVPLIESADIILLIQLFLGPQD